MNTKKNDIRVYFWTGYGFVVLWIWVVTKVASHFLQFSRTMGSNTTVVEIFLTGLSVGLFSYAYKTARSDTLFRVPLKYWPVICFLMSVFVYATIRFGA